MNLRSAPLKWVFSAAIVTCAPHAAATNLDVNNTTIAAVSVNGGADSMSVGTTCLRLTSPVSEACPAGYIAILNNNKQLIASALMNQLSGGKVWVYYSDASASSHCPGLVRTPCSIISIESK